MTSNDTAIEKGMKYLVEDSYKRPKRTEVIRFERADLKQALQIVADEKDKESYEDKELITELTKELSELTTVSEECLNRLILRDKEIEELKWSRDIRQNQLDYRAKEVEELNKTIEFFKSKLTTQKENTLFEFWIGRSFADAYGRLEEFEGFRKDNKKCFELNKQNESFLRRMQQLKGEQ